VLVREAQSDDLECLVEVHMSAFPGFFLTRMGPGFLRTYYSLVMQFPYSIILVADDGEQIIGFVCGYASPNEFYASLKRNWVRFIWPVSMALVRDPRLIYRVAVNRSRVSRASGNAAFEQQTVELACIGVLKGQGGRGVGRLLVSEFIVKAKDLNAKFVDLTTDAAENDAVNEFYVKLGFHLQRSISRGAGRPMHLYRMSL
jgi:ribosomal protein S18 acetylase RimI-like enzyme